jgi:hypothetical protein
VEWGVDEWMGGRRMHMRAQRSSNALTTQITTTTTTIYQ